MNCHCKTADLAIRSAAVVLAAVVSGVASDTHWSFQPVVRPQVPVTMHTNTSGNAIDSFLLKRLEREHINPSPEADSITVLRRVSLDLIGIPPTPEEVDAYMEDSEPDRYQKAVDQLLASPHYGEKWAVSWLDLCHYADTDGYLTDQLRPVAWRYRDWLIEALNRNLPFDDFTIQQLAADLLPYALMHQRLATGFLRQTLSNREGGAEPEEFRVKQVVDRTEMVGTIWLGLTVGCARCHDHKHDPLTQREFFQFYACLDNGDEVNIDAPLPEERHAFVSSRQEYNEHRRQLIDPYRAEIKLLQQEWESKCLHARDHPGADHVWDRQWELLGLVWGGQLGEGQLEGQEIVRCPWKERTSRQKDDLLNYFLVSGSVTDPQRFKALELGKLQDQLTHLQEEFPKATRAPVMQASLTRRQTYIHEAGDFRDRGQDVSPATPQWLPSWSPSEIEDTRLTLARWLVSRSNPLTARVVVNRMWEQFFGRGLIVTTENFGLRGEPSSHPALLDWLAAEFMDSGWDVKAMHRLIVHSKVYRRSSEYREDLTSIDPSNVLLAHQSALRLSAEILRDAGLAVSGLLYTEIGGPSVRPQQPASVTKEAFGSYDWKPSSAPDCYRRGIYTFRIRTTPFAQGVTFDAPNPNEICTRRARSNTPLQALTLLNDPVFFEMAQALADRALSEPDLSQRDRLEYVFSRCLAREPTESEIQQLTTYLQTQLSEYQSSRELLPILDYEFSASAGSVEKAAWTNLCSVILNLHEFITRD